jgi:hypothetical protein
LKEIVSISRWAPSWENRVLWQKHVQNEHLAEYLKVSDGAVDEFIVNEMTHIA